jgi:site-specific DNA recombinase
VFFDEESGGTVDRPKFQLMLDKAKQGCFDAIVFWKLDRFCRSLVDLVNVEKALRECGVGLSSVTEYVDTTTSIGRFNFRSLGSVAELERELIGQRARLGLHALAKEDKWPNPHPPFGYSKKKNGRLIPNEKAKIVLEIFEMYLKTRALPQVGFDLNERGILTQNGKKWNASAVRKVLTNQIYIGKYSVAGVEHLVEEYRVMRDDLFVQVQRILSRYKFGSAKRPPIPTNRKNAGIDSIFNQFLENINLGQIVETTRFKTKIIRGEVRLFRMLQNGWELAKVIGDDFIVRQLVKGI